jgi:hypothetical protein
MQLLIQRGQHKILTGAVFQLWARFDLKEEELDLLRRYNMKGAVITEGNTRRDVIKAIAYSVLVAMLLYGVIALLHLPIPLALIVIAVPVLAFLIYHKIRERIIINDILEGRSFVCNSITVLMEKEEAITKTAFMFREFLERMKTWGGREVTDIEPGIQPKLRLIESINAPQ